MYFKKLLNILFILAIFSNNLIGRGGGGRGGGSAGRGGGGFSRGAGGFARGGGGFSRGGVGFARGGMSGPRGAMGAGPRSMGASMARPSRSTVRPSAINRPAVSGGRISATRPQVTKPINRSAIFQPAAETKAGITKGAEAGRISGKIGTTSQKKGTSGIAGQKLEGAAKTDRTSPQAGKLTGQHTGLQAKPEVSRVSRFAQNQRRQNPRLASQIQKTQRNWRTNSRLQQRWRNDWSRFSYYHSWFPYFSFNNFINFVYFAPWFLFPFSFYSDFYGNYPIYWVDYDWFSYPIYWDYGYAHEITLVKYVQDMDFDDAITKLENRLNELETQNVAVEDLQAKINEIIWLLNDLEKIILKADQITQEQKDELVNRINDIKERSSTLLNNE